MTQFTKIRQQVEADQNKLKNQLIEAIKGGRLEQFSTPARWKQYEAGKISREKCEQYAIERLEKQGAKATAAKLEEVAKLEKAADGEKLAALEIDIVWSKEGNPTARARVWTNHARHDASGRAFGGNYDKGSAATAEALNKIDILIAELCKIKEANMTEDKTKSHDTIYYGTGYQAKPYFEGVGNGTMFHILEICGLYLTEEQHSKRHNYYYFETK